MWQGVGALAGWSSRAESGVDKLGIGCSIQVPANPSRNAQRRDRPGWAEEGQRQLDRGEATNYDAPTADPSHVKSRLGRVVGGAQVREGIRFGSKASKSSYRSSVVGYWR